MTADELLRRYPRETVRWLRRELGLTQAAFAEQVGVDPAPVAQWEAGRARIRRPATRRRLAALLAPQLATPAGAAFVRALFMRALGRGGE